MTKKKMQKISLDDFFKPPKEDESPFEVFTELSKEDSANSGALDSSKQKILVRKERKGRGGKVVTLVNGLSQDEESLQEVCKILKQRCGVGGSVKSNQIIIQGDLGPKITDILKSLGYPAILATA